MGELLSAVSLFVLQLDCIISFAKSQGVLYNLGEEKMKEFKNPQVRGESVEILDPNGTPTKGVLGATVDGANILVRYPDGEQGYVRESDIDEGE